MRFMGAKTTYAFDTNASYSFGTVLECDPLAGVIMEILMLLRKILNCFFRFGVFRKILFVRSSQNRKRKCSVMLMIRYKKWLIINT